MGRARLSDKPSVDDFTHVYAESTEADKDIVRITKKRLKEIMNAGMVSDEQLNEILSKYLSEEDDSEIVSYIEEADGGIKIYMRDGTEKVVPISQAKEFESVEFDSTERYLHFYDAEGNDVYDPVYIEGGGGGGGSSSVIKLTNQNGTNTLTVPSGSPVNLMFNFSSTEEDVPTGDGNCQISVNSITKMTFSIQQGLTTIDVSKYLTGGSNTVRVTVTDIYGASKSLIYKVSVVEMYIESTFDPTIAYTGDITYKYTAYGSLEKTIHICVDGDEIATNVTTASGKQNTCILPGMTHGVHQLEVYATAELDGTPIESKHLSYEILCTEENNTSPMISSVYNIDSVNEGELVSIPYIVLDPTKLATDISLDIYTMNEGVEENYSSQNITVDRSQQYWNTRRYPVGMVYFRIKYGQIYKVHTITVTESTIKVEPETNDLELQLLSEGRSNKEETPDKWTYGDYNTAFDNFNWNTNGWIVDDAGDTCLRFTGDATAEIQFKPFDNDIRTHGKTLEIEFAIRDVNNRDAVLMSCLNGGIGFEIKADTAYLKSEQSTVSCKYKEEEKVKLAFVVEARNEYRMLSVYLNGILSDVVQYPDSDNFQQTTPVNISIGNPKCGVDIYGIRSYSTALDRIAITNNYIADIRDVIEKTETYERNDIYDDYGNLSFEKAKAHNSVMVIIGDLPQSKGDKKTVKIKYYDIDDSSIEFADDNVIWDVQGTSSQFYVRKNWKGKFPSDHYIDKQHLPAKVICIKVDYAEATGTHNTQNAVFIEELYTEKIPPQESEPLTRTTIYGKPILLFHQTDENSEPTFYAKANFNYDKGAEHVFGFTDDYDVECWEFCNNTSDACNFLTEIPDDWGDDFEARYPEDYSNIGRFKAMHDWIVSTRRDTATGSALPETFTDSDGTEHTNDTAEYRLAKFKMEFEDHFNMHYSLIYYVYTFFALMVDQRAKNMFMTYWSSEGKWYPYFYDNDTCFGINNEGQLVFDYYHEDTDRLGNANVYNGQNSVLWCNFRDAFPDKIKETYQNLRNNGYITYDKLVDQFITNGSDKWSESVYNEDSDFKYITMLRTAGDASNLAQVRGSGEEHFRYFIENRLNYCDSKWYASDYADDYISLRIYTPDEWAGVGPDAAITVTPFSNMYAGVRYKANGTLLQKRVESGVPATFGEDITEKFNDTETAIYGAHQLSSIGDLAPLYCGSVNVSKADKLIELKVGDGTEGYSNTNLHELSVGTNKLLRKVDVQNCPNFNSVLDVSNCPSIEEIYAKGSGITGVSFPDGGVLKKAQLPATITNFTLKHQIYVDELTFEGYDNIKTLWIEDCPTVESWDIFKKTANVERVRLCGLRLSFDTADEMLALSKLSLGGIDENGVNTDTMWIDGTCHIETMTGEEFLLISKAFPYLTVTYGTITSNLIFMSEDGNTELTRQIIQNGRNGVDPVTAGIIDKPTKASTAAYDFTYTGWSLRAGGGANTTALHNVVSDRKVYAAFAATIKSYTVCFYNGTKLLQTVTVKYGENAIYTGETPTNGENFEFYGWKPSPTCITGNTNCYAQYHDLRIITDEWDIIAKNCTLGTATDKYAVGTTKELTIGGFAELPDDEYELKVLFIYKNEYFSVYAKTTANALTYKWDGSQWNFICELPTYIKKINVPVVCFNDEIYLFDGGENQKACKFNGSTWIDLGNMPYNAYYYCTAVVYDNIIHVIIGGSSKVYHCTYNGNEWCELGVLTLTNSTVTRNVVVYKNEMYLFINSSSSLYPQKWDGSNWSTVNDITYGNSGTIVVINDELYQFYTLNDKTTIYGLTEQDTTREKGSVNGKIQCIFTENNVVYVYNKTLNMTAILSVDSMTMTPLCEQIIPMILTDMEHDTLADGETKWSTIGELPYELVNGCSVVYNNEIHVLAGDSGTYNHYHWSGRNETWDKASDLPYSSINSAVVVFDNKIHVLGGSSYDTKHYAWDGSDWIEMSTLPYSARSCAAVVYNNELHIIGSKIPSGSKCHYKWNGIEWSEVSTLPESFTEGEAVVYNDELHYLGMHNSSAIHYKRNGSTWEYISEFPKTYNGRVCILNDGIHMYADAHYKYDGDTWTFIETLPVTFSNGCCVTHNNILYLLGGTYSPTSIITQDSSGKANMTFIAKYLMKHDMDFGIESTKSWDDAELRTNLNSASFINKLALPLQKVIRPVKKLYYNRWNDGDVAISNDKVWIPSRTECGLESLTEIEEGEAYSVFTDDVSRMMCKSDDDDPARYWTRTSSYTEEGKFHYIDADGTSDEDDTATADSELGILIGFCI